MYDLDTTKIAPNYFLDDNDDMPKKKYRLGDGSTACSFKATKVRIELVNIEEYSDLNLKIGVLKFVDVGAKNKSIVMKGIESIIGEIQKPGDSKNKGIVDKKAGQNNYQSEAQKSDRSKNKGKNKSKFAEDEINEADISHAKSDVNSENSSVNSSVNSANENYRQLKERRALINEKNIPKLIIVLKRTMLIILLITVAVNVIDVIFILDKVNIINSYVFAIKNTNRRQALIADESFQTSKLELLANGLLVNNGTTETLIKNKMSFYMNDLTEVQYNCTKAFLTFDSHKTRKSNKYITIDYQTYKTNNLDKSWYQFLLENYSQVRIPLIMKDAIYQFIDAVEYLSSSTMTNLVRTANSTLQERKYYYYIIQNCFEWIRLNNDDILWNDYYDYYTNKIIKNDLINLLIFIGLLVFLIVAMFIIIPNVLKAHKSTDEVLS